jgi:putative endonuclease
MYYVYVIQSKKDKQFYTGFTRDLENRIREHNKGRVSSTKERGPFELIYYEALTPDVNSGHETLSHAATCLA